MKESKVRVCLAAAEGYKPRRVAERQRCHYARVADGRHTTLAALFSACAVENIYGWRLTKNVMGKDRCWLLEIRCPAIGIFNYRKLRQTASDGSGILQGRYSGQRGP